MIINSLDLGSSHPWHAPTTGQEIGDEMIEGFEHAQWPRGSVVRTEDVTFFVSAWQAIGGQSANTLGAAKYLIKQLEELASSRDQQPVYIQWTATADPNAILNASDLHDGWYIIGDFEPHYIRNVVTAKVECRMLVHEVAPAAPGRVALGYTGGALSTNFSGTATNLLSLPVGSTAAESSFNRTAAEGSVPCILSPVASPEPLTLSSTIANIFKGGVHVYDTINTSNNAVPTSGGTFVNANWVEVFYSDHVFQGDCVITNGLQLLIFVQGAAHLCTVYLWSTGLSTANWQKYADINYQDVAGNIATLNSYSLTRVGLEECSISTVSSTSGGKNATIKLRLQRGRYEVRTDFKPNVEASNVNTSLTMVLIGTPKIIYNSTKVADVVLSEASPAFPTDYGYGAAFIANSADPFIAGFLYQNESGNVQPYDAGNVATVGLGDTTSLSASAQRSYGFFAIPYGVNASYSTANLQAEAESGTLGTGWSSTADAAASAGNTAKLASGTAAGNNDTFGTAFVPNAGAYYVWFRIKVTSAASGTACFKFGLWDNTAGAYIGTPTVYAPSAFTTSYAWYGPTSGTNAALTPTAGNQMRFRAESNTAAAATDFFVDEAILVPATLTSDHRGPQELWQQFSYDRSVRLVRP